MEQPANSSCFWLGLCLVVRYSIDFLSSVPLPSLRRYAPVLSIHSLRKGSRGEESGGWCLCDDTDPIRSHGKGVEHEAARRRRGIEFVRLRLQDEPWIWFLCYTRHLLLYIWASESVCVSPFLYGSITCVSLCGYMSVQGCLCSKQFGSVLLMFACIFFSFSLCFFFSLPLVWIPAGSHVQYCSKAVQIPLSPPTPCSPSHYDFPSNNMVKSNEWSVIIWNIFVETPP